MVATAVVLVGLTAGCAGDPSTPTPPPPPPATTVTTPVPSAPGGTATAPPSSPPPSGPASPAGNPDRCTTAELTGSLGPGEGAAGSIDRTLILTNTGSRPCELTGFPGVSYVTGDDAHQVGPAAAMSGERGGQVRLAVGDAAGAEMKLVNVQNYDAQVCAPTPVTGLRVYPPGDTESLVVPTGGTGCAGTPPGEQISVRTLTPR